MFWHLNRPAAQSDAVEDVRRLIEGSGLPASIGERVLSAVAGQRLRAPAAVDVAQELIAHFQDGLDAGREESELLSSFGDGEDVGRLIGRGKRVARRREAARERVGARGDSIVFVVLRDLRYAVRRMTQSPGFTATAVLSLALGIGANTAIFSVVNGLLLRRAPVERPEELVDIYESSENVPFSVFSYPDLVDFRDGTREVFSHVAGSALSMGSSSTESGVESLLLEAVSGSYFSLLGLPPEVGRLLGAEDDVAPGAHAVAVLGHGYWQRRFGGDPSVVGQTLRINRTVLTIVGVASREYPGNLKGIVIDAFVPLMMLDAIEDAGGSSLESRRTQGTFVKARLAPGVSLEQAHAAVLAVETRLREEHPDIWTEDNRFLTYRTSEVILFPQFDGAVRASAWMLLAVVGTVLLIACANLASFLLARAVQRRKEIAVRLALGATRGKLVGQLLTETLLLSLLGGAAGITLAA